MPHAAVAYRWSGRGFHGPAAFPKQGLEQLGNVHRCFNAELGLGEIQAHLHAHIAGPEAAEGIFVRGVVPGEDDG